jgi:hypothetical protein
LQAKTIIEVVQELDDIIDWTRSHNSRLGYFAGLYAKVTVKVKEGIADGFFADGERMARLIEPGVRLLKY